PQAATNAGQDVRVVVDDDHFGSSDAEQLRDRVPVLAKEIEDVQPTEAKVPAGGAKMSNLPLVSPIVDGLEVDLAEARKLTDRKDLRWALFLRFHDFILHGSSL